MAPTVWTCKENPTSLQRVESFRDPVSKQIPLEMIALPLVRAKIRCEGESA